MRYTQTRSIDLVLDSPDDVGKYGLTLGGSAYIDSLGLHTSAATSSNASKLLTSEMSSGELVISIIVEDLDLTTASFRYLYDSSTGARNYLYFTSTNTIGLGISNTLVGSIAFAIYEDYIVEGANEFLVSSKSGDTKLWLNGNLISTTATATTAKSPSELYIGAGGGLISEMDCTIKSFQVWKEHWSVEDVDDYFDNSLLSFKDQSLTWLDFRSERLDGSTRYLEDETGNGNNFDMVGDPEFQNPVGYELDTNDYFTNTSPSEKYTDLEEYSICIQTAPDFPLDESQNNHLWGESNTTSSIYRSSSAARLRFHFIAVVIAFWTPAELAGVWNDKSTNIIVASYKSGKNNIWINGHHKLVNGSATFTTPFTMTNLALCAQAGTGLYSWDGTTYHYSDYPFALSPLQALQLTSDLLTSKN